MVGWHRRCAAAIIVLAAVIGPTMAQAAGTITIGVAGPMTGPFQVFGEQMTAGARQAVADLNKVGGVLGKRLILVRGDDGCDEGEAAAVARRLVRRGASLVDGHFCSATSIAAAPVYEEAGTIMISPASSNPALTDAGLRNVFRVVSPDDEQAIFVARYVATKRPNARVAIIHDDSAYGDGLARTLKDELRKARRPAVLVRRVQDGRRDFSAIAAAVRRADAEIVFFGGFHDQAGRLARELAVLPERPLLIGPDSVSSRLFADAARDAADGTLVVLQPDPATRAAARPVVRRLRAAGIEPVGYVLYSYAAVEVWAQAVQRAGTTVAGKVALKLRVGSFDTVLGRLGFTANGDPAVARYVFYRWKNGRLTIDDPTAAVQAVTM